MSADSVVSGFLSRVMRVFMGTLGAQLILFSSNILLAKLYTPSEMGIYNLWFGLLSIAGVIVTARYELSFFSTKHVSESYAIAKLIFFLSSILSILVGLGVWGIVVFSDWLPKNIFPFIIPLIFSVFIFGINNTLLSLFSFLQRFSALGASKIANATAVAVFQIGAGAAAFGVAGLVYGQLFGSLIATILFLFFLDKKWKKQSYLASGFDCKKAAFTYRSFPIYSLPADLLNNLARQLPIFIVVSQYGDSVGGWYGMTVKMMSAPVSLLATSILEVFKEQASRDYREKGNCREVYLKTLPVLAVLAGPPFLILYYYSEELFVFVLGEQWRESGVYAKMLIPMYYAAFVSSPLSYVIYIAQKQRYDLVWQFALVLITVLCFYAANTPDEAISAFGWSYAFMYLLYLLMSYRFSKGT